MPSRPAPEWLVFRNGQLANELHPTRVEQSLCGDRLDYAELVVDAATLQSGLDNFSPLAQLGDTIDIQLKGGASTYIHRGVVAVVMPRLNVSDVGVTLISRTEPYLFGLSLFGQLCWSPSENKFFQTDNDLVFNPIIDGRVIGNKHNSKTYGGVGVPVFLDPEGARTAAAQFVNAGRNSTWLLSQVLYYLCWRANQAQSFLLNPSLAELSAVVDDSVDFVRNLKIPAGSNLPEALDLVLKPLGYLWRIYTQQSLFSVANRLQILKRSTGGNLVWLNHQRMGQTIRPQQNNMARMGIRFDASRMANQIVAKGGKLRVEFTTELSRGWPWSYDAVPLEDLKKTNIDRSTDPHLKNAWRKWVLNEAGDYIGLRAGYNTVFSGTLLQTLRTADLLKYFLPIRRQLKPTISRNADGTGPAAPGKGILLEYRDYAGTWQPAKNWGFEILETEAGIYISAGDVPEELYDNGTMAALRVTASLESDYRVTGFAPRQQTSPIAGVLEEVLDLADEFQWLVVLDTSKYFGTAGGAADDREAIQHYAEVLRDRFDSIDAPGGIELEGVDHLYYQPGDRVAGVDGKNISFRTNQTTDSYPQIVAITLDMEQQKTILQLQRFREYIA